SPTQAIMDDYIFEWEMEEEVVGELIADVFLKGEEFEEGWLVLDPQNAAGIPQTIGRSLALSSALKDLRLVGEPSGEALLQRANFRLVAEVNQCAWE
ncbi:hypothetical protein HAX54_022574, partial [Datura stramonium]|nr:hypothetical protein [Datura stramonium]